MRNNEGMNVSSFPHGELQGQIIRELGARPSVDPAAEVARRIRFLQDLLRTSGARGLCLGISGGQDSTLAGRMCQLACEGLRTQGHEATFYALRLPYGEQIDEADARVAMEFIQPDRALTIDIKPATDAAARACEVALGGDEGAWREMTDFNRGNVKARQRMLVQYAVAGARGLLVVGTDHAAEAITGFFTKFGDGAADAMPLAGLSKRQGAAMLAHLGAPESTWKKVPTADLEDDKPAQPDEVALGLSYLQIDDYLAGKEIEAEAAARLEALFLRSAHKRRLQLVPEALD